jgi:hypothetical protein
MESKQDIKKLLQKYILEVLIIFIGISISFLFDEWRENRKDAEMAKKDLHALKANLIQDTLNLTGYIAIGEKLMRCTNKLAYFKTANEIADSLDFYIDNASSYLIFKSNQMAYEEIKQSAHTNLIKNDSLKRAFLSYYTLAVPYCDEWCFVDKNQIMTQVIPEMVNYFPVVEDKYNLISADSKMNALKEKKLRNLLLMSATYKQESIKILIITKTVAKNLLKRIEAELNA